MTDINQIRIKRHDWNTPVFHFITMERLIELLVQKHNTLVAPHKWDDPFENILEQVVYRNKSNGNVFRYPLRDSTYGQCWTLRPDHDAAWRCYLPDGNGAQLTSSVKTLFLSLHNSQDEYQTLSCFIGKVAYKKQEWFADPARIARYFKKGGTENHVDTLLWKRDAFRWEREIRLLYLDPRNHSYGNLFRYTVDPSALISCITLDPRMTKEMSDSYTKMLRKLKFTGDIVQSSLYAAPDMEVPV